MPMLIGIVVVFTIHVFGVYWWYRNDDLVRPFGDASSKRSTTILACYIFHCGEWYSIFSHSMISPFGASLFQIIPYDCNMRP